MESAVNISIWNAESGLHLTPDMAFYAVELQSHHLAETVDELHRTQLTANSYEWFADVISDRYTRQRNLITLQLMTCATLAYGYRGLMRWRSSAVQTAVNIHLNTIGAEDNCEFPRIVPHALEDMRIERPEDITRDVIWRILVTEPWLSYAERSRAQYNRMRAVLSQPGLIEELPATLREIIGTTTTEPDKPDPKQERAVRRSIRRAYTLNDRLFGSTTLRHLLRGERVILPGRLYDYALATERGDLFDYTRDIKSGTPPFHTVVLRKSDQRPLCTLCIYFRDTPLIDHLIAFTLHLKFAETELDMLRIGQAQNISRAFYEDPVLPELKGLRDPVLAPATYVTNLIMHTNCDDQYQTIRQDAHETPWRDLATELIGYSPEVLSVMADGRQHHVWNIIENDEHTAPLLDRAKQCFR